MVELPQVETPEIEFRTVGAEGSAPTSGVETTPPPFPEGGTTEPAAINFHNRHARRAALLAAPAATFVLTIPLPGILGMIWQFLVLMGSGLLTYTLYTRWSGETLSLQNGARLGWLTGILTFVIFLIMATLLITFLILNPEVFTQAMQQMQSMGMQDASLEPLKSFQSNPQNFAGALLVGLPFFFVLFTLPAGLGGALAARWFGGRRP